MENETESQGLSLANILGDADAVERAQAGIKERPDVWEDAEKTAAAGFCVECEGTQHAAEFIGIRSRRLVLLRSTS